MTLEELNRLFQRDLDKLKQELELYSNEENLWKVEGEIANSAGNLAMHLIGNLKHFIGFDLGAVPYERNREREFGAKGEPRDGLIAEIDEVKKILENTLPKLHPKRLDDMSIHAFFGHSMTIGFFLIHLYGHFNYHLGQINYHRRLLDRN
ncbi:uncharacterized protein DUF1572 [Algoriphagus boseongensis]|uniref:Uncharacterized protein DUF1572 n=1 Tax=Algoriphagus boseongensis TaxID=1442587 RepID=A0A4R6TCM8_9BACT|nr:DinB family protein [Algoriphagus boseongensis]TDQ19204.1 uncharacterized protein DUF1572 [Algoriphagus boseongensis]